MRKVKYATALKEALREEMQRDERVFLLGEDIGRYGGVFKVTEGLIDEFGHERVMDTPISEAAIIGAAIGSAITGMLPVAEIMFIDFATVAMDQIVNQAAKMRYMFGGQTGVPIVIRTNIGSGRGTAAQHSQSLHAWFMHIPGLKIAIPSTPYDAKGLLKSAIRDEDPVMFIEHKYLYPIEGEIPEGEYLVPFGKADIKKTGKDVTIVATSLMVQKSLAAAEQLEKEGISVEVVDPRTLVPLDKETIFESVKKTGKALIVDEGCKTCGIGAEIAALIQEEVFEYLDYPVKRLGSLDVPVPFCVKLEKLVPPSEQNIIDIVKKMMG
ncbi:MAG: acetoin:2,6-dichlorophenolindophenol oxidoreductase subunit beta [Thermosediminibacterales bacterium]|nr:acetoin:2,6-dichlorophenolindophenol oxidoreductase subunit beta [Thermosediminibacterales bacterium]